MSKPFDKLRKNMSPKAQQRAHELAQDLDFVGMLNTVLQEMTTRQVADGLGFSIPTIVRWSQHKNLPHYAVRPMILKWLQKHRPDHVEFRELQRYGFRGIKKYLNKRRKH